MKKILLIATTLLIRAWAGDAPAPQLSCEQSGWQISSLVTVCKMVEMPLAFSGTLAATTPVGGISVVGWDQPDALVRAQIQTAAPGESEAESLASSIQINSAPGNVSAAGPAPQPRRTWSVTLEIFVPHAADLSLTTKVGGIVITDIKGTIRFGTDTGGVSLARLAGDVQGSTHVGGISIILDGDHWDGETLAVQTHVGGIDLKVPAAYSAHFTLSTGLGKIDASYLGAAPAPSHGFSLASSLTLDTGSGGSTIAAETGVGGIVVRGI
jgi:hypothetical protein